MKIEIELEYVDGLKSQIEYNKKRIDELEKSLQEAKPEEMEQRAITLAQKLFSKYMTETFIKIGFTQTDNWRGAVDFTNSYRTNARLWMDSDNYKINLSATMREDWKAAFLRIGVIVPEEDKSLLI